MFRVAIVHGQMLLPDGSMDIGFRENLDMAIVLARREAIDLIVISGGKTRKDFLSEAVVGMKYLAGKVYIPVRTEEHSTSCAENVRFVRERFGSDGFKKIYVIARMPCMPRLKLLYRYFWEEAYAKAEFVGTKYRQDFFARVAECGFYFLAVLDPEEKFFLRFPKMAFRNWQPGTY